MGIVLCAKVSWKVSVLSRIIDDHSRKVWIDFIKGKDEAFQKFDEWKIIVENQTGKKIKKLRSDDGLEFYNFQFYNV